MQSGLRALWAQPLQQSRGALASAQQLAALLWGAGNNGAVLLEGGCSLAESTAGGPVPSAAAYPSAHRSISSSSSLAQPAALPAAAAAPSSSAPVGAYAVDIAVQAFEKRYVDMACNTISDIVLLAFAPKSYSVLPVGAPSPSQLPVNLAVGAKRRDVRLPWRRTRFTLIRGPHIDKKGMEQFERREYKSILSASTNSAEELQRLLEALKMYQFTGVQIKVEVRSAQQVVLPPELHALGVGASAPLPAAAGSSAPAADASSSVGSPSVTIPAPRSQEAVLAEELDAVLRLLRSLMHTSLQQHRQKLAVLPEYQSWLRSHPRPIPTPVPGSDQQLTLSDVGGLGGEVASSGGAAGVGPASALAAELPAAAQYGGELYGKLLRLRLQQQLERQGAAGREGAAAVGQAADGGAAGGFVGDARKMAELLARIDTELLHAHRAALAEAAGGSGSSSASASQGSASASASQAATVPAEWRSGPPDLDASTMSAAEYARAVLQYVKYVDSLHDGAAGGRASSGAGAAGGVGGEGSGAGGGVSGADLELQVLGPGVALRLLQLWWGATSAHFKQHLALPPAEVEAALMQAATARHEAAAGKGRGGGEGRGGR